MPLQDDPFFERILEHCDAWEIIELCNVTTEELVDLLRSHILDNRERFNNHLELWDDWA